MSRSYRKTPITGNASCRSEKPDKKCWHSRMRARTRDELTRADEDSVLPEVREVSDVWGFGKDGKHWMSQDNDRQKPSERFYENKERRDKHTNRRKDRVETE